MSDQRKSRAVITFDNASRFNFEILIGGMGLMLSVDLDDLRSEYATCARFAGPAPGVNIFVIVTGLG